MSSTGKRPEPRRGLVGHLRPKVAAEHGEIIANFSKGTQKSIFVKAFLVQKEDKDGWITVRNWSDEEFEEWLSETYPQGITYRLPSQWDNSRFNAPNQPVVGVSWFEARAYCAWLSTVSGGIYTLPSEAEWEAAARRNRSDAYVYGADYLLEGGNTIESHLLQTTPVGLFPKGASPEGIHDLSGNTYDWTISLWGEESSSPEFAYPYTERQTEREDVEASDAIRRVLRGGSWSYSYRIARAAHRYRSLPAIRSLYCGFRLIFRPPSQSSSVL